MHVVIAPDSFKNCLNARDVAESLARGVRSICPDAATDIIPMSDGGDGLVSVLAGTIRGQLVEAQTLDPLGRPIQAVWLKTKHYAVIEMATASGLALLKGPKEYAPMRASTYGTGILIKAALDSGCCDIVVGLGGSATIDAGCGMASALGYDLLDSHGKRIPEGGGGIGRLSRIIRTPRIDIRLKNVTFTCLTDVKNHLTGPSGAAHVYGPQKGASPSDVELLERNLKNWVRVVEHDLGISVSDIPGAGAAGGLGAGCVAFLGATLESGAAWVAAQSGLRKAMRSADIIFTGEGKIDKQTGFGKVPAYVAQMAKKLNKPVIAFGGSVAKGIDLASAGITRCVQVSPPGTALADAIRNARKNLERASAKVIMEILT